MGGPNARTAAFFDVDRTVASSNLLDVYLDYALEGKSLLSRTLWAAAFAPRIPFYAVTDWTDRVKFIRKFFKNYRGATVNDLEGWAERRGPGYWSRRIFREARDEVERHRTDGHKVVLLTGGLMEMVRPLGDLLSVDEVMASLRRSVRRSVYGGDGIGAAERGMERRRLRSAGLKGREQTYPSPTHMQTISRTCRCWSWSDIRWL